MTSQTFPGGSAIALSLESKHSNSADRCGFKGLYMRVLYHNMFSGAKNIVRDVDNFQSCFSILCCIFWRRFDGELLAVWCYIVSSRSHNARFDNGWRQLLFCIFLETEPLTVDDLIPMLSFLIVRSSIPTW